ncbi:MAG: hypothetical protein ABIJ43_04610 [Candidatus Beckwithbacteria bacterium]|nr:hypothetical protein [Patescibacteria group bacterium]
MKVSVFGNPDIKEDNLVVKMVPELKKKFPEVEFRVEDPSEGLKPPENGLWVILDVAVGIDKIRVFEDLDKLTTERKTSLHDYDVAMELKLLKKLGRIEKLKIVAVPGDMDREKALREIVRIIENI